MHIVRTDIQGVDDHAEDKQLTGYLSYQGPEGECAGDTVPGERLSAAGRHHGVRLLRGGAGQRGAAAGDLQARHLHHRPGASGELSGDGGDVKQPAGSVGADDSVRPDDKHPSHR